jgi:hypothetical protein
MFTVGCSTIAAGSIASNLGCSWIPFWPKPKEQMAQVTDEQLTFKAQQPLPATRAWITPLDSRAMDTPVTTGTLPLVYLIGSDGAVHVDDLDQHKTLATAKVSHNGTIAVDAIRGVIVNGVTIAGGPLPEMHHYGIYYSIGSGGEAFISKTETNDPGMLHAKPTTIPARDAPVSPFRSSPSASASTRPLH